METRLIEGITNKGAKRVLDAIVVPPGNPPILDGKLSPGEWESAAVAAFADGSELLLMHADGYLYLGIRSNTPGMIAGNVFIQRGEEIAILHSSAALGTAVYQKSDDQWQQTQEFTWQCRMTSHSDAAQAERKAFLQQEGWVAANSRTGVPEELEYRIGMSEDTLRLAVNFIRAANTAEKVPWPPKLDDDCIKPTPGGLPSEMHFAPEHWGMIWFTESAQESLFGILRTFGETGQPLGLRLSNNQMVAFLYS